MIEDSHNECSLLILPDGRLLVRNVTPELSALLTALQPDNPDLAQRAALFEPLPFQQDTLSHP